MTDNELDHLMRNILLDAIALDEESCKEDRTFEPSLKHQRQMTAMLANPLKWAHSRARPVWKKALQKIAVIFLTFSLGLGSLMAVSPTVRATVARWSRNGMKRISHTDIRGNRILMRCRGMELALCRMDMKKLVKNELRRPIISRLLIRTPCIPILRPSILITHICSKAQVRIIAPRTQMCFKFQ